MSRAGLALAVFTLAACSSGTPRPTTGATPPPRNPPRAGHVWVIDLENRSYDETFGAQSTGYLARTLVQQGALLRQYYAIGHVSNDNYIAQISGQAPNPSTQGDCTVYREFDGDSALDENGQVHGRGCVYPATVLTLADQLEAVHRTWKAYMEDMGEDPQRESSTCGHPPIDARDDTQNATPDDQYATRHNPFVYFHSIIDDTARCDAHVVSLQPLKQDLQHVVTTPSFSFISPNLCNDGHDNPCIGVNVQGNHRGGMVAINAWLQKYIPMITSSAAYRQDGLIIITFDEAETESAEACCDEPPGPNVASPGGTGQGGGRVGAVLLSPFIRPATLSDVPYNHYALLRSLEDLFGIGTGGADGRGHLGFAAQHGLHGFGRDVFTAWAG